MRCAVPTLRASCGNMHLHAKRLVRGVVFDMDGTCTKACIDFQEMRRRAGILTGDILGVLDELPPARREEASKAIEDVELEALPRMQVMPGLLELCKVLDDRGIPRGIITRNSKISLDHFHKYFFKEKTFLPALCRDFKPYKPSPAALLHICQQWGIQPQECLMVGDSVKDDVVSGNRAKAISVLLDVQQEYQHHAGSDPEAKPTVVVHSLNELAELLKTDMELQSPMKAKS